jgi:hydroxymethylbilane synthase
VGSTDGSRILADAVEGHANDAEALGGELARQLLSAGAGELL